LSASSVSTTACSVSTVTRSVCTPTGRFVGVVQTISTEPAAGTIVSPCEISVPSACRTQRENGAGMGLGLRIVKRYSASRFVSG